jgi:putative thiamine transport system permease protein
MDDKGGAGLAGPLRAGPVNSGGVLRQAPRLTILLLTLPVLAGLAGTIAPAFGVSPLPGTEPGLTAFRQLADWPGLPGAMWLSVKVGVISTLLSLALVLALVATLQGSRLFAALRHLISPLLSVPHAAAALGLAFLIAPSGWILRALSPWATGWTQPPDLLILNDPGGWALIAGLVAKEMPFLFLMTLAALPQTGAHRRQLVAATIGYGRAMGFLLTVLPPLYSQLRLPVYAVLAYAMTSVEMAMILGPARPPLLAVQITQWMTQGAAGARDLAAAAALLQLALVVLVLGLWAVAEQLAKAAVRRIAIAGWRLPGLDAPLRAITLPLTLIFTLALVAGLAGLALWSLAGLWSFPDAIPETLSLRIWAEAAPGLFAATAQALTLALASTLAALALVLACLEVEHRFGITPAHWAMVLLFLPLIVPQVAFLPGLTVLMLGLGVSGGLIPVALAHLVFVLPYVFLSLSGPWRAFDPHVALLGRSLGASPDQVFWRLRLPMLLAPVLTAAAVGFAVSIGQYLPTLLIGGGRIETLTTEAVALASGGNRRLIGAYALLQLLLPALGFALAMALPRLLFRHRRGMVAR